MLEFAGREGPKRKDSVMITVTVNKTHGAQTVRASISAPSIEEAVRIAGEGARLEFPIDAELFFAPQQFYPVAKEGTDYASTTLDGVEAAYEAGFPTFVGTARWSAA